MVKSENKRILLKLSGESLMGSENYGIELEVIDKIAAVKTGQADKPIEDIPVTFKVKKANKEKISKQYGYSYPE